jgi:hypothetical protein
MNNVERVVWLKYFILLQTILKNNANELIVIEIPLKMTYFAIIGVRMKWLNNRMRLVLSMVAIDWQKIIINMVLIERIYLMSRV